MSKSTVDISTAAKLLGLNESHVARKCRNGDLPGACKDGGRWMIPVTADARLAVGSVTPSMELPEHVTGPRRDEALRRAGLVAECERFCAVMVRKGFTSGQGVEGFCSQRKMAERTMYRWMKRLRTDGILGLVDQRGSRSNGLLISEEAWEMFKALWLDDRQPSVALCWRNVKHHNKLLDAGWTIPTLRTMQRLASERIPQPVAVLHRQGMAAYETLCAPYIETDMDSIEPGAVWIGDHHQFDCWVLYRGKFIRPWITAWEDMRSRTIVGWCITASPNSSTILIAFKKAAEQYGPPDAVKIDNGKDYDSEMFTGTTKQRRRITRQLKLEENTTKGIYAMMGIAVSFARPYHPQSKAIERWFATMEGQFGKTMKTYCGPDSARRPEDLFDYLKTDKAVAESYELNEFAELVNQYIAVYNKAPHTGRGMDGRSPATVIAQRNSRRVLADGVLDLLCRVWTGVQTVGKNGVRVKGLWYGTADVALMGYQQKQVRISYDPEDMSRVWVYEAATYRLICVAEQARMIAYGAGADEQALREATAAQKRARRAVKNARNQSRTANMDLTSLTIEAMEERTADAPKPDQGAAIRPAATVMDSQVRDHQRQVNIKMVRRAAGAENVSAVPNLQLNLESGHKDEPEELPELNLNLGSKKKTSSKVNLRLFENG